MILTCQSCRNEMLPAEDYFDITDMQKITLCQYCRTKVQSEGTKLILYINEGDDDGT